MTREAADIGIALVGMEELPALTALRLRQGGLSGARALEGVRGAGLWRALKPFDVLHAVYPVYYFKWVPALKAAGKKVVFHWIGSDWYQVTRRPGLRALFRAVRRGVDLHVADAPWLVDELAAAGVQARLVPTISEKMSGGPEPMPARFRVMAYLPDRRRSFYGWPAVRHVAEQLADVEVVAVGGAPEPGAPANVRFAGLVDGEAMARLYGEVSALVRPTSHDGLSQMVLEALLRGRQVVWSRPFPHCRHAATPAEFAAAVAALAASCPQNVEGSRYVARHYSAEAASRALAAAYEELFDK
jgi:glycosyltransferase involved in cell wall biosynthesis